MSDTLKPCPFCGCPPREPDGNGHTWCSTVSCGSTAYMSVNAWNERPSETALAIQIDPLVSALKLAKDHSELPDEILDIVDAALASHLSTRGIQ